MTNTLVSLENSLMRFINNLQLQVNLLSGLTGLSAYNQSLNTTDDVTFHYARFSGISAPEITLLYTNLNLYFI